MHTLPLMPTLAATRLARTSPTAVFALDARGCAEPHGKTVMNPLPTALMVVTLRNTALASAGTCAVPVPVTLSVSVCPPAGLVPVRVSSMRSAFVATYDDPAGWNPTRSTIRSVDSDVKRHTEPSAASGADTRFVVISPGRGLKLDAVGSGLSHA